MKLTLFSPRETLILTVLQERKKSITEIVELINRRSEIPCDNNVIANAVRRINKKCEYHQLPWFLNGAGGGRAGRTVWKDKR